MVGVVLAAVFFGLLAVFLVWRAVRLWRDEQYFQVVLTQRMAFGTKADLQRGLARATPAFAIAVTALAAFVPLLIATSGDRSVRQDHPALAYTQLALFVLFLLGIALQLSIAWFNQPKFLVPPYLRNEPGVRELRRKAGTSGR